MCATGNGHSDTVKRLLLPALAALLLAAPSASAPVAAAPSIGVDKTKVTYGGPVVVGGTLPVAKAGEKVVLRAEVLSPTGTRRVNSIAETSSTNEGTFAFTISPTAETTYTVSWQATPATTTTSNSVLVRVAPRVGLSVVGKVGRTVTFSTKATSAIPYAGRTVVLQRRNALGRWVALRRATLTSSTSVTRTAVALPKGLSRVRVLLPQSQVGTGYVAGFSRVVLVRL